jgi:hypothetical protein
MLFYLSDQLNSKIQCCTLIAFLPFYWYLISVLVTQSGIAGEISSGLWISFVSDSVGLSFRLRECMADKPEVSTRSKW